MTKPGVFGFCFYFYSNICVMKSLCPSHPKIHFLPPKNLNYITQALFIDIEMNNLKNPVCMLRLSSALFCQHQSVAHSLEICFLFIFLAWASDMSTWRASSCRHDQVLPRSLGGTSVVHWRCPPSDQMSWKNKTRMSTVEPLECWLIGATLIFTGSSHWDKDLPFTGKNICTKQNTRIHGFTFKISSHCVAVVNLIRIQDDRTRLGFQFPTCNLHIKHQDTHSLSMTRHSTPFSSATIFADLTSSLKERCTSHTLQTPQLFW